MSLATRLTALSTRVGTEIKAIRNQLNVTTAVAVRWEQEMLVMAGQRVLDSSGDVPFGIHVPYNVRITGIRYQFYTSSAMLTEANLYEIDTSYNATIHPTAKMSIAGGDIDQTLTGLNINVQAGSRLFITVFGSGGSQGDGLSMSLWGEYR